MAHQPSDIDLEHAVWALVIKNSVVTMVEVIAASCTSLSDYTGLTAMSLSIIVFQKL